ncbi:hypothetical protein BDQ17DRAFT_1542372 [Cyathus striatus]|nr:hypothetical protein BDQ17DRAFT_1542372 [Cyathus striatus]
MFSLAAFALTSVFLATAQHQCLETYTVVAGDTCDLISQKEHVSSYQLTSINYATINSDCSNLFVGEVLCLATQEENCPDVSVVHSGDSCNNIAYNSGISVTLLIENNPNVNADCTNLHPGELYRKQVNHHHIINNVNYNPHHLHPTHKPLPPTSLRILKRRNTGWWYPLNEEIVRVVGASVRPPDPSELV